MHYIYLISLESCRCPPVLYTNFWSAPPYLTLNEKDAKIEGILSGIIPEMFHTACGICPAYGETRIEVTNNGKGNRSAKKGVLEVLSDIDDVPQISFPIYGNKYITKYLGYYSYINIVESPGVAFIVAGKPPGQATEEMITAVLNIAPLILMLASFVYISGFIIWLLVSAFYSLETGEGEGGVDLS